VKRIVSLLALLVLLTGCTIRMDSKLVLNEDESGTFAIEMSADEELRQLAESEGGEPIDFTEGLEDVPAGWTVEEFTDGEFQGIRVERAFASIQELEDELSGLVASGNTSATGLMTDIGLTHEGDEFRFNADLAGIAEGLGEVAGGDLGEGMEGFDAATLFDSLFEIRLIVTLPGSIGENNADKVDGNTLTWLVTLDDEGKVIEAVSTVGGGGNAIVIALAVLAGLVLIGLGAAYLQSRKRKKAEEVVESMSSPIVGEPPVDVADVASEQVVEDAGESEET